MSSSSAYTLQLPYLGSIPLGRSPPNLSSFQKPLRELYASHYRQRRDRHHDERRIIISDRDILIFEPDAASKGKRALIYSTLEAIVDVQAVEFYLSNKTENGGHHKRFRAAFLPIGCEHQERFRSLYSTVDKSQSILLSICNSGTSNHPPLVLFVIRKSGTDGTCSLLDCHVFTVHRESIAFELCDMIRKLIIKRTMSPLLSGSSTSGTTLIRVHETEKNSGTGTRTKYLNRDRPISAMQHSQAEILHVPEKKKSRPLSNMNLQEMLQSYPNGLTNPMTSSSFIFHDLQHSDTDINKVLAIEANTNCLPRAVSPSNSSNQMLATKQNQQRHFIKASSSTSSIIFDESDEVVNDLMNIVVAEKMKTNENNNSLQIPVKRQASFDRNPSSNEQQEFTTTKKRHQFHNHHQKKRSLLMSSNPLPTILSAANTPVMSRSTTNIEENQPLSPIDNHLMRPQLILNRYGDIGNYVPKLLRDNTPSTSTAALRSSDSNENIFFRATNGHILNGFLNLDFNGAPTVNNNNNNNNNSNAENQSRYQYRSSPCLSEENQDQNIFSLVRQLRKSQRNSLCLEREIQSSYIETKDDTQNPSYYIPRVVVQSHQTKQSIAAMGGVKVLPASPLGFSSSSTPSKTQMRTTQLSKPKRVSSFTTVDSEFPIDYRQYLRHTDRGDALYGQEKQRQSNLERSLGYLP